MAVTKTHGVEKVQWGYRQGLRHFGENYVSMLASWEASDHKVLVFAGEGVALQVHSTAGWCDTLLVLVCDSVHTQSCKQDYGDIKWHYLGHVQRKKMKILLG